MQSRSKQVDDLAAIMKENRGVKILKDEGGEFKHFQNEWHQAQNTFRNTMKEEWTGNMEEAKILAQRFEELSRVWGIYKTIVERAKCKAEVNKLKLSEKF